MGKHGDWVPLTVVRVSIDRPDGVGAAFVARTGLGRAAFAATLRQMARSVERT